MLVRQTFVYIFGRLGPAVLGFLALTIFSRLLTPDEYGRYSLVVAAVGLANAVLFQWLRHSLVRGLAAKENRIAKFATAKVALWALVLALVILTAISLLLTPVRSLLLATVQGDVWWLVVGLVMLAGQAQFDQHLSAFRGLSKPVRYSLMVVLKGATFLALGWLVVSSGLGGLGLSMALAASLFLSVFLMGSRDLGRAPSREASAELLRGFARYGLPLVATFALSFVVGQSDRFMLAYFHDTAFVGLYAVPYEFVQQSLGRLMLTAGIATLPLVAARLDAGNREAATSLLRQGMSVLMAVSLPAVTALLVVNEALPVLLFGADYREVAAQIMPIIVFSTFLWGLKSAYLDLSFQLSSNTLGLIWVSLVACVTNIGVNLILIPEYGVAGAAYASVAAYGVAAVMTLFLGRSLVRLPWPALDLVKMVAACGLMALAMMSVPEVNSVALRLAMQLMLGGMVYAAAVLALNVSGMRQMLAKQIRNLR